MDAASAFILVVPAMLLLLIAGACASWIERITYNMASGATELSGEIGQHVQLEQEYGRRRSEFERLRIAKSSLDDKIAAARKERASLQDQERRLADRNENLVAEAGYPTSGGKGYYIKLEGPSAVMPYAGLASLPTALGGRRQVRMIVWAVGQSEAQTVALNWAGSEGKIIILRPFSGRLYWHEA